MNNQEYPLVSIVMPTYNRAGYISETIASIQNQTYENWELLILDDGSTDNTEAIVKQLNEPKITYYKFDKTAVTGKLKNYGINIASGELIAFMDSDDLWAGEKLEKQVTALLRNPNAGYSFTNGYNFIVDKQPGYFLDKAAGEECGNIFHAYCNGTAGAIFIQTIMIWKERIKISGPFNENRIFTDYSFIANIAYHHDAVILYEPLLKRRIHDQNYSNKNWEHDFYEQIETLTLYKKQGKISRQMAAGCLFVPYLHFGMSYANIKEWRKAFKYIYIAWTKKPGSIMPFKKIVRTVLLVFKLVDNVF